MITCRPPLVVVAALLLGCSAPALVPLKPEEMHTGVLAFLQDGRTTREEVLTALGTPSGRFEGERILTYTFVKSDGRWRRLGRRWNEAKGRFEYPGAAGTGSLVLVFGPDSRLARHSLVAAS